MRWGARWAGGGALIRACGGDSISGPVAESCGPPPYLTLLPVPAADLESVSVVGGVDAPGPTLWSFSGSGVSMVR